MSDTQRRIADPLFVLVLVSVLGFSLLGNFIEYRGPSADVMMFRVF